MMRFKRTNSDDPDFIALVGELDAYLRVRNGEDDNFYRPHNKTVDLATVLVAYDGDAPVACGAIRPYDDLRIELKRMYVLPSHRGKGFAKAVVSELEAWARELGFPELILETGTMLPEAISLYAGLGFQPIPNYPPYEEMSASRCFSKSLVGS